MSDTDHANLINKPMLSMFYSRRSMFVEQATR
jgi:hypothetical protein